ncbi:hypothetical protein FEDK69T_23480 [Flavobacterium enshiense DK69]|uniref:Lipoprotein n=1 Tax=Flavobacterium enshiense DK69 TaxID=1107311 RepID=V6S6N8_9FLAO|nr:hypothetical protein [Flavobacterium enshiense]ESU22363.1 hypothetical protein FEDK69T_23480 [Flavobacterium enshiense DK69]KGO97366.1 hypothetical protein Q767_01850 [Flavobacterium enshiense DK69]
MIKLLALTIIGLSICSCNNDIKIITNKDNKECRRLATCFIYDEYSNNLVGRETNSTDGDVIIASPNIDKERELYYDLAEQMKISNKDNIEFLSKTKTLSIKNFSENKVYNVRIKKTYLGKVTYKDYKIEPTEEICIGCDTDFDLDLEFIEKQIQNPYPDSGYYKEYYLPFEGKIKKANKIEYSIHKIDLISEY